MGYVSTTSSQYDSGFLYGLGLTEGRNRIGFGISAVRFSNTYKGEERTVYKGEIRIAEFEETVADFFITIMGLYRVNDPKKADHVMLGAGPQIHFVSSFSTFTESARGYRLGAGMMIRYQRRIEMFGRTSLVVTAGYSHMQSVGSRTDLYDVPTRSMNITTVTAGLAFPF
jgi:hypothetical protein